VLAGLYETAVDRESAYEKLKSKVVASGAAAPASGSSSGWLEAAGTAIGGVFSGGGSRRGDTVVQAMVKSAARTMDGTVGRQIVRGVLGSLLGGSSRR
jgi:uncharacterized protein